MDPKYRPFTRLAGEARKMSSVRLPDALREEAERIAANESGTFTELVFEGLARVIEDRVAEGYPADALREALDGQADELEGQAEHLRHLLDSEPAEPDQTD